MGILTQRFISELIRAANEVDKLTKIERARLLRRASYTIRDQREQIGLSRSAANERGPEDVASDLMEVARLIEIFSAAEIANFMLEAVEVIKGGRLMVDAKHDPRNSG